MRNLFFTILLGSLISCLVACNGSENTSTTETEPTSAAASNNEPKASSPNSDETTTDLSEYIELDVDMFLSEYTGQKIWLSATISKDPLQHMMKENLSMAGEEERNVCIDFNDSEQCIAYYKGFEIPKDDQEHKYYGIVDKISGVGKGGDTHTEYYIDLDKVE